MSRFQASIMSCQGKGNRGKITRQTTDSSGVQARVQGSNIGAHVFCYVDKYGDDVVGIVLTGGDCYPFRLKELESFRLKDLQAQGLC